MRYVYQTINIERPDLVGMLANPTLASELTIGMARKVDWVCPNCGTMILSKAVNKVVSRGLSCPICSDGVSKPEKIVLSGLSQAGVRFIHNQSFKWSNKKRYDFFLVDFNAIIEVNGSQHYGLGFRDLSGVSHEEQVAVDSFKQQLALKNGISMYRCINATDTSARNIIPQLHSILQEISADATIDIAQCERAAMKSNVALAADMWSNGMQTGEICDALSSSRSATIKYLKAASDIGLCDYEPLIAQQKSQLSTAAKRKRRVRCITTGEEFESLMAAAKKYGVSGSNIIRSCNSTRRHAGMINGEHLSWEYM